MNKLIKLLNEWLKYQEKFGPDKLTRVAGIDDSGELLFKLENGCYWSVEYVISKRCGFIEWLVENDKIDRDNAMLRKSLWETDTSDIDKIIYTIKNSDYHYVMREAPYEAEETLLMLLSISEKPIEFLISILKKTGQKQ